MSDATEHYETALRELQAICPAREGWQIVEIDDYFMRLMTENCEHGPIPTDGTRPSALRPTIKR